MVYVMSLDAVAIVMYVEDHFGIRITNAEAERVLTVGDLVSLIFGRISNSQEERCPTLQAFLTLRAATRAAARDGSLRIKPRDHVINILKPWQRREL